MSAATDNRTADATERTALAVEALVPVLQSVVAALARIEECLHAVHPAVQASGAVNLIRLITEDGRALAGNSTDAELTARRARLQSIARTMLEQVGVDLG